MTQYEKNISKLISNRIKEIDSGAEVILYGSHARGQSTKDSDWDILILLNKNVTIQTEQKFRHHLLETELEIGEPISVYVRSKEIWESKYKITPFYKSVMNDGIQI